MFRPTDRQLPLQNAETTLSPGARQRLKRSWAEGFRQKVMPLLLSVEPSFSVLYAGGGRPNWSVARLVGVILLQQLQNLSDQQALDELSFDIRWQHALDVTGEEAYLSRRSLVEFRRRLVQEDPDGALLRAVFDRICQAGLTELGLSAAEQRLDSTLIVSDIRSHGRLSLARETLRVFVHSLSDEQRGRLPKAVAAWYAGYSTNEWEREEDKSERKKRLHEMGELVQLALEAFANDEVVREGKPYGLLRRLWDEHKESLAVSQEDEDGSDGDNSSGGGGAKFSSSTKRPKAAARGARKRRSRSKSPKARFWSPHDPDASFGHKGLGYHAHITETCRNEGTELLTDYALLTAAQSDIGQSAPTRERLTNRGLIPNVLYADGGYPTPGELINAKRLGTELYAPVNRGKLAEETFSRTDFQIDRESHQATRCPAGHAPVRHGERESSDSIHPRRSLYAFFATAHCTPCPMRSHCPVRQPNNARSHEYRLELSEELLARDDRWKEQQCENWKERYRIRSGVEATMSELKRGHGMGRLRVRGHARVLVQVALKATACNIKRWLRAEIAALGAPWAALSPHFRLFGVLNAISALKNHLRKKIADAETVNAGLISAA